MGSASANSSLALARYHIPMATFSRENAAPHVLPVDILKGVRKQKTAIFIGSPFFSDACGLERNRSGQKIGTAAHISYWSRSGTLKPRYVPALMPISDKRVALNSGIASLFQTS